jgi:ankyrin repeat protein
MGSAYILTLVTDAKNCNGRTPIHFAASSGSARLKSLLRCEPNVHMEDHDGNTALHFTVLSEDDASIKVLVQVKPSMEPQNKQGLTAFHLACLCRVYRHCSTVEEWTT